MSEELRLIARLTESLKKTNCQGCRESIAEDIKYYAQRLAER